MLILKYHAFSVLVLFAYVLYSMIYLYSILLLGVVNKHTYIHLVPGGALGYRGGPHLRYVFRGRRGLFLRPPHVRDFVKEGYFFVPRYEVWGSKSPYNPRNIHGSDAE